MKHIAHHTHHAGNCPHGNVRLVGPNGPNAIEGRVEYCSNGVWGTVSNLGFDSRDGEVICKRLGHQNSREAQIFTCQIMGVLCLLVSNAQK